MTEDDALACILLAFLISAIAMGIAIGFELNIGFVIATTIAAWIFVYFGSFVLMARLKESGRPDDT